MPREKLLAAESALVATHLVQEIENLSEGDLQTRAIAFLKAENRLTAEDARRVDDAFSAKTVATGASSKPIAAASASTLLDPSAPLQPSTYREAAKVRRRRGRQRKVKPATEQTASAVAPDTQMTEQVVEVENGPLAKLRYKVHLRFVASHPCLICDCSPADAHHVKFVQHQALGLKVSDEFTVPLCRAHHRDNHRFGDERAWWSRVLIRLRFHKSSG